MTVRCLNCGYEFETENILNDELGKHVVCPKCESSFDVGIDAENIKLYEFECLVSEKCFE